MQTPEVFVAILSLFGTLIGSLADILAANKLTMQRIAELKKKVDPIIERFALLKQDNKTQWSRIDDL